MIKLKIHSELTWSNIDYGELLTETAETLEFGVKLLGHHCCMKLVSLPY